MKNFRLRNLIRHRLQKPPRFVVAEILDLMKDCRRYCSTQSGNRWSTEEIAERESYFIEGPDFSDDLHRDERMAAQGRELLMNTDLLMSEGVNPNPHHFRLNVVGRLIHPVVLAAVQRDFPF